MRKNATTDEAGASKEDKDDYRNKKAKPSASIVPGLIGNSKEKKRIELCKTWKKVGEEH